MPLAADRLGSARASRAHFGALAEMLGRKVRDGEAPSVRAGLALAREARALPRRDDSVGRLAKLLGL